MIKRSREAEAFLTTIDQTAPEAVSACDGWTTHEIAAHVRGAIKDRLPWVADVLVHVEPSPAAVSETAHGK